MAGTRRGHNEGSIYQRKRDGRWVASLSLGDGRRKVYYADTRNEAKRLLTVAMSDQQKGLPIVGDRQTVEQFATHWLETVQATIRPRTWRRYGELLRLHVLPTLGRVALSKLSPQHVQHLYGVKLAEGLSSTTVHHLHAVLHRALDSALRFGLVARNVCDQVDAPRMRREEMHVLTREEARTLLDAAEGERLAALYVLALSTGMRQGELLALHWRDVELDGAALQVRLTLQRVGEQGMVFSEPKTKRSRRKITLPAVAVAALREHRTRQLAERLAMGPVWKDHDLVFPNTVGQPMDARNMLRTSFLPLLARAGLPRIRFHDLRHTAATLLLLSDMHVKKVSELLGHSTIAITLDTYSHVLPTMQGDVALAMDALFAR